jgi:hypothetical protein
MGEKIFPQLTKKVLTEHKKCAILNTVKRKQRKEEKKK